MAIINFKMSGQVISELSEKIPSNIIALNELIKNAYDAMATKVDIELNTSQKKLIIIDNGVGMDHEDVHNLFHISNSKKKYGTLIDNDLNLVRYTQGSKGIGFLSVFKFGKKIKWETRKENSIGLTFSASLKNIQKQADISDHKINLKEKKDIETGTKIEIDLQDYDVKSLENYFSKEKNCKKIINAFYDNNFIIRLTLGKETFESECIQSFKSIFPEQQLFYIEYSSKESIIKIFNKGKIIHEEPFKIKSTQYELSAELIIYHLPSYGKRKISSFFYRDNDDALTPLIYINGNLFNNYDLFDPSIMKSVKTSKSLPQMIGYIRIISSNQKIDFNSDRTRFVQNDLTDEIRETLEKLNIQIQSIASSIKNDADTKDDMVGAASPISTNNKTSAASIILAEKSKKIVTPSKQINLMQEIISAKNSQGEYIQHDKITITIDGIPSESKILESITASCSKKIQFSYLDALTGNLVEELVLEFITPTASIKGGEQKEPLLSIPARKSYIINIQVVNKLINQLNKLYSNDPDDYNEVIACSLRSIFEICTDELQSQNKISFSGPKLQLSDKVSEAISFIKNDNSMKQKISDNTGINYTTLDNMLSHSDFKLIIDKANLGAHKSSKFIGYSEIEDLAKKASCFAVLANELLHNIP